MNKSLPSDHRCLAVFYALVVAVLCGLNLAGDRPSGDGAIALATVFGLPVMLHLIALKGVRSGQLWGHNLSRAIALLMLFAVPIGTVFGVSSC
ncbi:hypothetical protein ACWKW4_01940 [Hydrogenophaga borbori]|uniref:hypothetical protein n=1 Tax=Hydrogenophaga borbori TaxID=2294117 RepID=UPI00301C5864